MPKESKEKRKGLPHGEAKFLTLIYRNYIEGRATLWSSFRLEGLNDEEIQYLINKYKKRNIILIKNQHRDADNQYLLRKDKAEYVKALIDDNYTKIINIKKIWDKVKALEPFIPVIFLLLIVGLFVYGCTSQVSYYREIGLTTNYTIIIINDTYMTNQTLYDLNRTLDFEDIYFTEEN